MEGKQIVSRGIVRSAPCHSFLSRLFSVFVTSKSYIYITPSEVAPPPRAPQISDHNRTTDSHSDEPRHEPIYENIENGNIVPSDDNKFTIYVNYDFINGGKCKSSKSSVRLLEPDVTLTQSHRDNADASDDESTNADDDNNVENNSKTMSKMIQCQQISMYIGEKNSSPAMLPRCKFLS